MKRTLTIFFLFAILPSLFAARVFFIAPDGDDSQPGTMDKPFATIMRAQQFVSPGDTVYLRGGTYTMKTEQIARYNNVWGYVHEMNKSGSATQGRIHYWAYPGERPIFDMREVKPPNYRVIVFYVNGSYLHFKGLEITGTQVTITTHTQSECFRNEGGNYNIYEECKMYDGMAIGWYLTVGSYNLVLNCDAYNNWDSVSENGRGGNVDGFGPHPRKGSVGNVLRSCRAWFNSDDGFDCISAHEAVLFENCWSFYNGYTNTFVRKADGAGFKVGGFGQAPVVANLPDPIPEHRVQFCLAYRNKANGFYANHQPEARIYWFNNTAWLNAVNYNMLSQKITVSTKTGKDTTIDTSGIRHVLINNIALTHSTTRDTIHMGTSINTYNTFTANAGLQASPDDFISLNAEELIAPRQPDGSLPHINFLRPKPESKFINAGRKVGLPYTGTAPDIGALQSQAVSVSVDEVKESSLAYYPNPANDLLFFKQGFKRAVVYDLNAQSLIVQHNSTYIPVSALDKGIYIVAAVGYDEAITQGRFIKL